MRLLDAFFLIACDKLSEILDDFLAVWECKEPLRYLSVLETESDSLLANKLVICNNDFSALVWSSVDSRILVEEVNKVANIHGVFFAFSQ